MDSKGRRNGASLMPKPDAADRLERKSILAYLDRQIAWLRATSAVPEPSLFELGYERALARTRRWVKAWRPRTRKPGGRGK